MTISTLTASDGLSPLGDRADPRAWIRYPSIDDCLGPSATRFFGEGFRRVGVRLYGVAVRPAPAGGGVTATAEVRYPAGWSVRDAHDAPRPHLSTIDTLVIAVQAAEAYLTHSFGLQEADRRRMWVRVYTMRAGTKPQEDLAAVPVHGTALHTVPVLGGLGQAVTSFEISIGVMRISFDVEHDVRAAASAPAEWADAQDLLGAAEDRYYGRGFARRPQRISAVEVDTENGHATALVAVGPEGAGSGFAANYEPALSMVDAIVATAQMAQAAMYGVDGVERWQTGTLWMRRLWMTARTPLQPLSNPFVSSLSLRRKRLDRGGASWRLYEGLASFQGIEATASLAYTVEA